MKTVSPSKTENKNSEQISLQNRLNFTYRIPLEKIVILLCILTSLSVLTGWFLGFEKILSIIPGSATMKFNTALIFLIAGINLYLFQKEAKIYQITYTFLSIISIVIGTITLAGFFGLTFLKIENLIVTDTISEINPGIMSPSTALCSILTGLAFLGLKSKNKIVKYIARNANAVVTVISLLAIISYVLLIPSANKTSIFQTMAIHTAVLFFILSGVIVLKSKNSVLYNMITGQLVRSQIFRQLLPKVIIFPLILGNLLLVAIYKDIINSDFGIVTFTLLLIILSVMYISYIALGLNITENKRIQLEKDLKISNKNLNRFKRGIDRSTILVIMNHKGIIKYANDAFCKISKYTHTELIGSHYDIINSDSLLEKEMWETLNTGEIWSGDKKNKAKDGSSFWAQTNIIPFKNEKGKITEFLSIKRDITKIQMRKS